MKLIELMNNTNTRSVDLVDSTYDRGVGFNIEDISHYEKDDYYNFLYSFISETEVINDNDDLIEVNFVEFTNKYSDFFDEHFYPLEDQEEGRVAGAINMISGNVSEKIYQNFTNYLKKSTDKDNSMGI